MTAADTRRISGTLIVAGIGTANPFEALLDRLGGVPERMILVEPAETSGGAHAQRYAGLEGVALVDAILSERAEDAALTCYNLPGLRSTQPPNAALRSLFPGLRERARIASRALPAAQAIGAPEDLPAPLRLRLDLPGVEGAILQALDAAGVLARVELVSLRCGAEAMFEGAWDRARALSWLRERHFHLEQADEADADWPELQLKPDPARKRIAQLEAETAKLREALTRSEERAQALEANAEDKQKTCAEALRERDKAYSDLGVAIRMQGMLQSDLDDLRDRYRRSEETRHAQEELLRKLTPRLQEAAQQLRQMHLVSGAEETAALLAPDADAGETAAKATKKKAPRSGATRKRSPRKKAADGQ